MDSTSLLIDLQGFFHSAMKYENGVMIWLAVSKLWEFTISLTKEDYIHTRASCIVFLFVKSGNDNFIKEIRYVLRAFTAWWTRLHLALSLIRSRILPNVCLGFHKTIKHMRKYFISVLIHTFSLCISFSAAMRLLSFSWWISDHTSFALPAILASSDNAA